MDFEQVERNLRQMFRVLASRRELGETRELPGISIASLGTAFQMFNAAFLSAPAADEGELVGRISLASLHMRRRAMPWSFWLCEDWLPTGLRRKAVKLFERQGLWLASEMPGMVAQALKPPVRKLPDLRILPATDEITLTAFRQIGATCFNLPLMWFEDIFDRLMPLRHECAGYVGYYGREPIATAATIVDSGVIGVYNVGTLPAFRERGFGEAIMRHAVEAARQSYGLDRTILQSTRQGLRLYERMGYRGVTRFLVFTTRSF